MSVTRIVRYADALSTWIERLRAWSGGALVCPAASRARAWGVALVPGPLRGVLLVGGLSLSTGAVGAEVLWLSAPSSTEVERQVTIPVEEEFDGMAEIDVMTSTSHTSGSDRIAERRPEWYGALLRTDTREVP